MLIADVKSARTGYIELALVRAASVRYKWPVSPIQTGKLANANARGMIEQAVQHSDAVAEVALKQRHERAAVPSSVWNYADASSLVTADPFGIEAEIINLIIEVVRLGQLRQKSAAAAGECSTGEELLHGRSEPRRCVLRDPAKDRLAVVTKVRTQQCQQLENDLVRDLEGHFGSLSGAPFAVADFREEHAVPLQELTFLLDFLRRARGTRRICGLTFRGQASVRRRTRLDETLTKQDAQPMACATIRNDVSAQPVPQ